MGKKFEIRSATIADISGIQQVARLTWRDTYRAILPDVLIDDFLAHAYSDDILAHTINRNASSSKFWVADKHGTIVGFAQFVRHGESELEVTRIYVLPSYQGLGIGKSIIEKQCRTDGQFSRMFAWVEKDNQKGICFYEAKGFAVAGSKTEMFNGTPIELLKYTKDIDDSREV